ncbi:MAG: hypothetical protein ACI3XW_06700 [Butyricicoccus sp.]
MELYQEILIRLISERKIEVHFPMIDLNELIESRCYQTLKQIKMIIEDDSYNDEECFIKIEKIICEFEALGSNGGFRHDFG